MDAEIKKENREPESTDWVWYERPDAIRLAREYGKMFESVTAKGGVENELPSPLREWGWYEKPGAFRLVSSS